MARTCKYPEELNKENNKCSDYFISHSKGGTYMCRLSEWKKKKGVCPYDSSIFAIAGIPAQKKLPKEQTTLK